MSQILILLCKSLLTFWRSRGAVIITFLVPIALIFLFGHVFGLYKKDSGPTGIPIAVVNLGREPAAQSLIDALKAEKAFSVITTRDLGQGRTRPLTEEDVRAGLCENNYRYALILPADLLPDDDFGVRMRFLFNPRNDIESQMVNGLLQKTVFSNVPQLLGQSLQKRSRHLLGDARFEHFNRTIADTVAGAFGGDREQIYRDMTAGDFGFSRLNGTAAGRKPAIPPGLRRLDEPGDSAAAPGTESRTTSGAPRAADAASSSGNRTESSGTSDIFSRIVKIDTEQVAGKQLKNPMAARLVGGYAIMFILMAVGGSATSLFEEKNSGVFQRLMASPVRPAHILWARFLFGVILGIAQLSALLVAGRVFFGLEIFNRAGALLAVGLASAAACSAFGMLVAAVSSNAATAQGISTLLVLSMSALGGAWFPISFMPEYIQRLSKFTLVYWSVEGFADVLWAGLPLVDVLPKVGILAGIAGGVMLAAIWRFNRGELFD